MKGTTELVNDKDFKEDTNASSPGEKDMVHDVGVKDGPVDLGVLPPRKELGIQGLLNAFVDSKEEKEDGSEGRLAL